MNGESSFIKRTQKQLAPYGILNRVENNVALGFPDVVYTLRDSLMPKLGTAGYIEFKYVESWPQKPKTLVRIPHFTPKQRNFIRTNGRLAPFRCWLFIQIGEDYVLYYKDNIDLVGKLNKEMTLLHAYHYWLGGVSARKLARILTMSQS